MHTLHCIKGRIYLLLNQFLGGHDGECAGCLRHMIGILGGIPVISVHVEIQRGLVKKRLLMLAGDVESNPGPCKFCINLMYFLLNAIHQ